MMMLAEIQQIYSVQVYVLGAIISIFSCVIWTSLLHMTCWFTRQHCQSGYMCKGLTTITVDFNSCGYNRERKCNGSASSEKNRIITYRARYLLDTISTLAVQSPVSSLPSYWCSFPVRQMYFLCLTNSCFWLGVWLWGQRPCDVQGIRRPYLRLQLDPGPGINPVRTDRTTGRLQRE